MRSNGSPFRLHISKSIASETRDEKGWNWTLNKCKNDIIWYVPATPLPPSQPLLFLMRAETLISLLTHCTRDSIFLFVFCVAVDDFIRSSFPFFLLSPVQSFIVTYIYSSTLIDSRYVVVAILSSFSTLWMLVIPIHFVVCFVNQ